MVLLFLQTAAASCAYFDAMLPTGTTPRNTRIFISRVDPVEVTLTDQGSGSVVATTQTTTRGGTHPRALWLDPEQPLLAGHTYEVELDYDNPFRTSGWPVPPVFTVSNTDDLVAPPTPAYLGHYAMQPYSPGWIDAEVIEFQTTPDGTFLEVTGTVNGEAFLPFISIYPGAVVLGRGQCSRLDTLGHPLAPAGGDVIDLEVRHLDAAGNASEWVSVTLLTESRTSDSAAADTGLEETEDANRSRRGCSHTSGPVGWAAWWSVSLMTLGWTRRRARSRTGSPR